MYGDGFVALRTRYTSNALAVHGVSKRCEGTTWKASPARMRSLMSSTATWKSGPPQSAVYSGSSEGGRTAAGWATGLDRSASIASRRVTASA